MPGLLRRFLAACLCGATLAGVLVGLQASPAAAAVGLSGSRMWAPNTSYSGSADAAEKVNVIVKSGDVLYVGGSFSQIRPEPGPNVPSVAQANLYAVDTRTGAYLPAFRPAVNGIVEALEVDPATGTLFVGGRFTQVNGQANPGFAILDAATGAFKQGVVQRPVNKGGSTPGVVMGLKRVGRQLYVGGDFVNIGTTQRGSLARLNLDAGGAPDDTFRAFIAGLVRTMDVDPANPSRVYVGGEFGGVRETSGGPVVAGTRWLAALLASTGAADPAFVPNVPCDTDPMCTNPTRGRRVAARNGLVYVAFGGGSGRFGVYQQSTGQNLRMIRTDGDVQTASVIGDRVYVGGHFTRITSAPAATRCQLFALAATSPWTLQPDPNISNGSHLGVFEIAPDAGADLFVAGHLVSPNTAGSPACDMGNSTATYNHIVRLTESGATDTAAPSVPAVNVAPGPFTAANVSWSPSSDASGITAYYVSVNGVRTAVSGASTFHSLRGLNPRTTYTVQVQALDRFGNRSALSAPVSVTTGAAPPTLPNPLQAFGQFFPTPAPERILDTRSGIGGISSPVAAGAAARFRVTGVGGVPATGVQSVIMNVTVTEPTVGGFVTISPTGVAPPTASNLNFTAGQTVPNLVQARVGAGGTVEARVNAGSTHLIADVVGWIADNTEGRPGARIEPQSPQRVLDTRASSRVGPHGAVGQSQTIEVQVVPPNQGYTGVVVNLTGTEPTSSTYVTAFPGNVASRPFASNLNLRAGETRPNLVVVGVSPQGTIKLFNLLGTTQLVVDVVARFRGTTALDANPAGRILSLDAPVRLVDTRIDPGVPAGPGTRSWSFATLEASMPAGVTVQGMVLNATATEATASTFLTLYPGGSSLPMASNLNVTPGQNVPNLAVASLSPSETLDVYNLTGNVHYLFDVTALVLG
jgi:hypothetical protein